jgi:hypothetical protein
MMLAMDYGPHQYFLQPDSSCHAVAANRTGVAGNAKQSAACFSAAHA